MGLFTQLFGDLVAFVYHCFGRIVIHGYLGGTQLSGCTAQEIHHAVLTTFHLSDNSTNSATICQSSRGTGCWSATATVTPTASP